MSDRDFQREMERILRSGDRKQIVKALARLIGEEDRKDAAMQRLRDMDPKRPKRD